MLVQAAAEKQSQWQASCWKSDPSVNRRELPRPAPPSCLLDIFPPSDTKTSLTRDSDSSIQSITTSLLSAAVIWLCEYFMFSRWLAGRPRCATQGVSRSPLCSWEILIFANGIKYFYMVRVSQTLFIWLKPVELWPNKAGRREREEIMKWILFMSIEWCHFTGSLCARVSVFCITGLGAGVWLLVTLYTVSSSS